MKKLLGFLLLFVCTLSLWAVPAQRITITVNQPDGTQLAIVQHGDEHFHFYTTVDGVPLKKSKQGFYYAQSSSEQRLVASVFLAHNVDERSAEERAFIQSSPQLTDVIRESRARSMRKRSNALPQKTETLVTGDVKVPVILVQYKDVKFTHSDPVSEFNELLNSDELFSTRRGYGSARRFFLDQSEGKFSPHFDVLGPVTLSNNMEYYGGNDEEGNDLRPTEMISEACRLVNSTVDFKEYDNNGDGYVDFVYVIYAGYGEASNTNTLENTIWPHKYELYPALSLDAVKIGTYACSNELYGYQGNTVAGIGTLCHEFSHCLGLPDFYDIDYSGGFGMSSWSIMNSGSYNDDGYTPCGYTGYEKDFLGWKPLVLLNSSQTVTMRPISEGGEAYKIVNDANENEFYVVENHKSSKWDADVPAEGMLVIHVDYLESAWLNNGPNDDPNHQRMTIIPADNQLTDATLAGDTYPGRTGNTSLTATSTPAAKVYKGGYMGKDITDISKNGDVVTFSFMKGALPVPQLNEFEDVTESGFTVSWKQTENIQEYEVYLERLEKSRYILEEDFSKVKAGNTDIGATLDNYTIQEGWRGTNVYGLDGAIRLGKTTDRGALVSPTIKSDSTCYTVFVTIRKSASTDNDANVLIAVGDNDWEYLLGGVATIDHDDWILYNLLVDTIGESTYFYIDTRDNDKTPESEVTRVDIDDIYILPGDWTKDDVEEQDKVAPYEVQRTLQALQQPLSVYNEVSQTKQERTSANQSEDYIAYVDGRRYNVTPIHTVRTTDLSYRFENLEGGYYRTAVRGIQGDTYSRYSEKQYVQLTDEHLPLLVTDISMSIDNDTVRLFVEDKEAALYYTTDGSVPTAYSDRYVAPFGLDGKATIKVIARKSQHRSSEVSTFANWRWIDGVTYRIISTEKCLVSLSESVGGNGERDYAGHFTFGSSVLIDSAEYQIVGIDDRAFCNAVSLRSVEIENDAMRNIGADLFHGCTSLNAIVWNTNIPFNSDMFDDGSYSNLLLYVPHVINLSSSHSEKGDITLVVDGKCGSLRLDASKSFYCPRTFVADTVSYTRFFLQTTAIEGSSSGWETIVLPFDVQHISHQTKGELTPFGSNGSKCFWLATLTEKGFAPSTAIRANVPYIIAMPNNTEYGDHSLNGNITFMSNHATIQPTDELKKAEGKEFIMMPTFSLLPPSDMAYALNINAKYSDYSAGSVFVPNKYNVSPFSAYVTPKSGYQSAPMFRIHTVLEVDDYNIEDVMHISVADGVLYLEVSEPRDVVVYDAIGRKVTIVSCKAGMNVIPSLSEGIYVIERTKVCVRH